MVGTDPKEKKEIEIVIIPAEGDEYVICSCKYKNKAVGTDEYETLKHYAWVFGKSGKFRCFIFSKGCFIQSLKDLSKSKDVTLVTLEDLYRH